MTKAEELQKLHNVQVEILNEIVRICNENDIQYYLDGGTCLGAVRHKGFIPWDDDLDIAMMRKDYDKFKRIAPKELDKKYRLDSEFTNDNYWLTFIKVRKKGTLFAEKALEGKNVAKEIYVDIFPIDNVSSNGFTYRLTAVVTRMLTDAIRYKSGINEDIKLCRRPLCVKIFSLFNLKFLHKIYNKIAALNKNDNSKYVAGFSTAYTYDRAIFERRTMLPFKKYDFEGKKYYGPNDCDKYLTIIYGDYMKLPKKEDRVTHNAVKIFFGDEEVDKNE